MNPSSPTLASAVGALTELSEWAFEQLGDELASRQDIAEHIALRLRDISVLLAAVDVIDRAALAADPRVAAASQFLDRVQERPLTGLLPGEMARGAAEMRAILADLVALILGIRR